MSIHGRPVDSIYLLVMLALVPAIPATALPTFTDIGAALDPVSQSAVAWGDIDADGDLDLVVSGWEEFGPRTQVYVNEAGEFVPLDTIVSWVYRPSADWGDYDGDGDLDLLLTGRIQSIWRSQIWRNDDGQFAVTPFVLEGVYDSDAIWGDYDNDGDLDILLSGTNDASPLSGTCRIYRNDGDEFVDIEAGLPGVAQSAVDWGDYDGDGDLDIVVTGLLGENAISRIYRNDGSTFTDIQAGLLGVRFSAVEWGDYDADGDPDLLLSGAWQAVGTSRIYRNDGGVFTDIAAVLPTVFEGSASWGDADNDGDLDILFTGLNYGADYTAIFENDAGSFADAGVPLAGVSRSSGAWGDYDADGDLDLVLSGFSGSDVVTKIYRNESTTPNTPPGAPGNLAASLDSATATLSWQPAADLETPAAGLSYNLRIGTSPGAGDLYAGMADAESGLRHVPRVGGAGQGLQWNILLPARGRYYWSVQAIDAAFAGGAFAPEQSFEFLAPFEEVGAALDGNGLGTLAWGDHDADGDLDLLVAGPAPESPSARLFANMGGAFAEESVAWPGTRAWSALWNDFDVDGEPDIFLSGYDEHSLLRNDAGAFAVAASDSIGSTGLGRGDWGDFDNDGDPDLILSQVLPDGGHAPTLYRNDDGQFVEVALLDPTMRFECASFADFDNDRDFDLVVAGYAWGRFEVRLYRNDEGTFADYDLLDSTYSYRRVEWGDFDADGDLDLLLTGGAVRILRNQDGEFEPVPGLLQGGNQISGCWADYDNDGDLDLLRVDKSGCRVFRNDDGPFVDIVTGIPGAELAASAWADHDGDGDADFAFTGRVEAGIRTRIFRNRTPVPNLPPAAPPGLTSWLEGTTVHLEWEAAVDDHTPSPGLSYEVRLGTSPGAGDILSAMADPFDGTRRLAEWGNAGPNLGWRLELPGAGTYYWSVQAIDGAYLGSPFAAEASFEVPVFATLPVDLPALSWSTASWADYDLDQDLDFVLAGAGAGSRVTTIYRNDPGGFVDAAPGLPGLERAAVAWADFDGDGDPDLALAGFDGSADRAEIYRNDDGIFVDIGAGLDPVAWPALSWADFDNDTDLDLLVVGEEGGTGSTRLYRNQDGQFFPVERGLPDLAQASTPAWCDFDLDGDLDVLLTGRDGSVPRSVLCLNEGGQFVQAGSALADLYLSSADWADFDGDGDPDLLLCGSTGTSYRSIVYRNDGGVFTDIDAGLVGVTFGTAAWGDADADGDPDILVAGLEGVAGATRIYRNDDGIFVPSWAPLPGGAGTDARWGDCDADGRLDLLLTGPGGVAVWSNQFLGSNLAPPAPTGLSNTVLDTVATFSWEAPTGDATPPGALTYNLRIGTAPGLGDVVGGEADIPTGFRRLVGRGNVGQNLSWRVKLPALGTYFWSVQAIDAGLSGGAFAPEEDFTAGLATAAPVPAPRTQLHPARPNPFNPRTTIAFDLEREGRVRLEVFDLAGRRVATLVDGYRPAGPHSVRWHGTDAAGRGVASGVYVCRLAACGVVRTIRFTLVR